MKKLFKRLLKKEEGQAFAEYAVLFPGAIMVVIAMMFSLGPGLRDRYCDVVGMFSNGICADAFPYPIVEPFSEPDGSTFCHCEVGEGEGAEGLKNCHPVQYNPGHDGHEFDYWSHDGTCEGWHDFGEPGPWNEPQDDSTPTPLPESCTVLQLTGDCSQCEENPVDCVCLPGVNAGTYEQPGVQSLVIYAGKEYHIFYSGFTDDGCYYVEINDDEVWWEKYMNGHDCKKIDHLQAWQVILCPGPD